MAAENSIAASHSAALQNNPGMKQPPLDETSMRPQGCVKNGSRGRSPFYECRQWGECIFFLFLFSQGQWSTNKLARTGGRCENGL